MKTQNEITQQSEANKRSSTTEEGNDESITARIRQIIEEWDEEDRAMDFNKFRRPDSIASSAKSTDK